MDQRQAGIRSTRVLPDTTAKPNLMELVPQTLLNDRKNHVYMTTTEVEGKLYSNQTGRFPVTPNQVNGVVVIIFCADGNCIKLYPIKLRHRSNLLNVYNDECDYLHIRGYRP